MPFDLVRHTILLAVTGSRAYGIHRPDSDVDVKGVAIPPARYFHGFAHHFEQADRAAEVAVFAPLLTESERAIVATSKLEGSVYDIRKLLSLATACNPNILDVLFCRDEEVRLQTDLGRQLRAHRHLLLSATARQTYGGYAAAQLKRIQGHRKWLLDPPTRPPTRAEHGLPEHTLLPADQIAAVNAAVAKEIGGDAQGADDATWLAAARRFGLDDNLVYVMVQERAYAAAARHWKQYETWRTSRNPDRAAAEARYGYDTKHAAHLVRLLRMAWEILDQGVVHVWRGPGGGGDADEIRAVRDGAWTYDDLLAWATSQDTRLEARIRAGGLAVPPVADRAAVDDLCVRLVESALRLA
jgi:uncharacterized protein